jgi:hypothetical protein
MIIVATNFSLSFLVDKMHRVNCVVNLICGMISFKSGAKSIMMMLKECKRHEYGVND